ncbi:MAG: hypothetical protein IPJ03_17400 [Ignavibacteriales bacterium]|nr:hypothetical protein [Ignavibacteriales bacterium]
MAVAGAYNIGSNHFTLYKKISKKTTSQIKEYEKAIGELLGKEIELIIYAPRKHTPQHHRWHSYREYLESPEWQEKRKVKLKQANNKCQVCNSSKNLHIHHRTYERIFNEKPEDLTVLCSDCHQLFHQQTWSEEKIEAEVHKLMEKELGYA